MKIPCNKIAIFATALLLVGCQTDKKDSAKKVEIPKNEEKLEPIHIITRWDSGYGNIRWGVSRKTTRELVKMPVTRLVSTPHIFLSYDLCVFGSNEKKLFFREKVNNKFVDYTYYFSEDMLYMVVKDYSDQEEDVKRSVLRKMEKMLIAEFGMEPQVLAKEFPTIFGNTTVEVKTQTWQNDQIIVRMESKGWYLRPFTLIFYSKDAAKAINAIGSRKSAAEEREAARELPQQIEKLIK